MPRLPGGSGFVQMDVQKAGAQSRQGKAGCGGERAGGKDGEPHVGKSEKRFRQGAKVADLAGEADDFIDRRTSLPELHQQALEPERGKFSLEGMGRKNQIPFGAANGPQHASQPREIGQFQIDHIGKRNEGQEKQDSLAGSPIECASLFPGAKSEKNRQILFGHGAQYFFRFDPFGEQQIQPHLGQVDAGRRLGKVKKTFFSRNSAHN